MERHYDNGSKATRYVNNAQYGRYEYREREDNDRFSRPDSQDARKQSRPRKKGTNGRPVAAILSAPELYKSNRGKRRRRHQDSRKVQRVPVVSPTADYYSNVGGASGRQRRLSEPGPDKSPSNSPLLAYRSPSPVLTRAPVIPRHQRKTKSDPTANSNGLISTPSTNTKSSVAAPAYYYAVPHPATGRIPKGQPPPYPVLTTMDNSTRLSLSPNGVAAMTSVYPQYPTNPMPVYYAPVPIQVLPPQMNQMNQFPSQNGLQLNGAAGTRPVVPAPMNPVHSLRNGQQQNQSQDQRQKQNEQRRHQHIGNAMNGINGQNVAQNVMAFQRLQELQQKQRQHQQQLVEPNRPPRSRQKPPRHRPPARAPPMSAMHQGNQIPSRYVKQQRQKQSKPEFCPNYGSATGCKWGDGCWQSHENPLSVKMCTLIRKKGGCPYGNKCYDRHQEHWPSMRRQNREQTKREQEEKKMVQSQPESIPIAAVPDHGTTGPEEEYSDDVESKEEVLVRDSTHSSEQQSDEQKSWTNHGDDHDINETDGSHGTDETDEEDLRRQEEEKQSEVMETATPMDRESVHSGQRSASPKQPNGPKPAPKARSPARSASPKQKHVGHVPDSVFHRIDQVLYC